jgi:transcriptional regulator with XRE-family HTH domain
MSYNFGKTIKELRRERGLTQEQLAEIAGVSPQAISKWETNATYPDISLLPVLANYFDVSIDTLLAFDVTKKTEDIRALLAKTDALLADEKYAEAVCLLRKASVRYPGNDAVMYKLARDLRYMKAESEENYEEAIYLYQKLLETGTDAEIRAKVTRDLMYCYYTKDREDLALEYAKQLPPFEVCREYNLGRSNCLHGKELSAYLKSNVKLFGEAMIECLEYFADANILTPEEKGSLTAESAKEKIEQIKKIIG